MRRELWFIDSKAADNSLAVEIERILPAGTDVTVVTTAPLPGLDFAQHLNEFVPPESSDSHNRRVARCVDRLTDGLEAGSYRDVAVYRGISLWAAARHSLFFALQHAVTVIAQAASLLDDLHPSNVRVWHDPKDETSLGTVLAQLAHLRGVQCAHHSLLPSANIGAAALAHWHARFSDRLHHERIRWSSRFSVPCPTPVAEGVRVLAPEVFPSHQSIAAPILESLQSQGVDLLILAMSSRVTEKFSSLGIPILPAYRIASQQIHDRLKGLEKRAVAALDQFAVDPQLHQLFAVTGVDLRSLCWPLLRRVLLHAHKTAATAVEQCQRVIDCWHPHAVLVTTEVTLHSRIACEVARVNRLPSVDVQHGVMYPHPLEGRMVATKYAVWGEGSVEFIAAEGNSPERLTVTGCPKYDKLFDSTGEITSSLRTLIPPDSLLDSPFEAVFTTQPAGSDYSFAERDRSVEAIVRTAQAFPESRWIFKLHPADKAVHYERIVKASGAENVEILHAPDVIPWLARAHLVVTLFSTTGIEAMLLGKPLIQVNLSGQPERVPYADYGAALAVRSASDLAEAVRLALWDPRTREALSAGRRTYLDKFVSLRDGHASRRVAQLVLDLVQQKQPGEMAVA